MGSGHRHRPSRFIGKLCAAAVTVAAVTAGALTAVQSPAVAATVPPSHLDCAGKDVVFIGARGSGESPQGSDWSSSDADGNLGATLWSLYNSLLATYPAYHFGYEGVAYPAAPVTALWSWPLGSVFLKSTRAGGGPFADLIQATVQHCPTAHLIVAGYSQGAWAMHEALNDLPSNVLTHVSAVVAYGDPQYDPLTAYGYAPRTPEYWSGVGTLTEPLGRSDINFPKSLLPATADVCRAFDPVCHARVDKIWLGELAGCLAAGKLKDPSLCAHLEYVANDATTAAFIGKHLPPAPPPKVTTTTLPAGQVQTPYSARLHAIGVNGSATWSLVGSIPAGLRLHTTGVINGTPTRAGEYQFGVRVHGTNGWSVVTQVTLQVAPAAQHLSITTTALPPGTVGSLYTAQLAASGGTPPYTWSITTGVLPDGLILSPGGVVSGTPTTASTASLTLEVSDAIGSTATEGLALAVGTGQSGGSSVLTGVVSISHGFQTSCAVLSNGSVDCWGASTDGELGAGLDTPFGSDVPEPVTGISNAISVSPNGDGFCALLASGGVDCWGDNEFGELGAGLEPATTPYSDVPVPVIGITNATSISADGFFTSCAVLASGSVDCWGYNNAGELGAGRDPTTTAYSDVPVAVTGVHEATSVSGAFEDDAFCALLSTGGVDCWGDNEFGELGAGLDPTTTAYSDGPVAVTGISDAVTITDIDGTFCVVRASGGVACWGNNYLGALGAGLANTIVGYSDSPVPVSGISRATTVSPGAYDGFCAVLVGGSMDCWGDNTNGALGAGLDPTTTTYSDIPVPVIGVSHAVSVSATERTSCAILSGGGVDCWGDNTYGGELGAGLDPTSNRYSDVPVAVTGIGDATGISADVYATVCAVRASGEVDCWGDNAAGELGAGLKPNTTLYSDTPVPVAAAE